MNVRTLYCPQASKFNLGQTNIITRYLTSYTSQSFILDFGTDFHASLNISRFGLQNDLARI